MALQGYSQQLLFRITRPRCFYFLCSYRQYRFPLYIRFQNIPFPCFGIVSCSNRVYCEIAVDSNRKDFGHKVHDTCCFYKVYFYGGFLPNHVVQGCCLQLYWGSGLEGPETRCEVHNDSREMGFGVYEGSDAPYGRGAHDAHDAYYAHGGHDDHDTHGGHDDHDARDAYRGRDESRDVHETSSPSFPSR